MNIFVFGCSWSDDRVVDNNITTSWVYELSKIMPEHNFYNFAYSGSSVHHSILIMESVLTNFQIKPDKIIFQVTSEGRVTYYKNQDFKNFNLKVEKISNNYFKFDIGKKDNFHNVCCVNYGMLNPNNNSSHNHWTKIKKFAKIYYTNLTKEEHFDLEYKIQLEYIKQKSDLFFLHKKHNVTNISSFSFEPNNEFLVIEDLLPINRDSFIIDNGFHFSYIGCKWQAEIIKHIIKKI